MRTRDVIDRYYQYANSGDWDNWLTLFAADVVVDEQLAGHLEGIDNLRGFGDAIDRGYSKFHMDPQHVVVQGDEAAVFWHLDAANASRVPIDAYGANYFSLTNGLISYMRTLHDTVPFIPFTSQDLSGGGAS